MPKLSETTKRIKIATIWASLEGCEGGDLLRWLAVNAEYADDGRGYAYTDAVQEHIFAAMDAQIEGIRDYATSDDPELYGFDPDEVREALEEIERIQAS